MSDIGQRLIGVAGLGVLLGLAWLLSCDRRRFPVRVVAWGLGLQLAFALLILKTRAGRAAFAWANDAFARLISFADDGARFVVGDWSVPVQVTDAVTGKPHAIGFLLAFKVLPVIIFFAALMSILYHLGVMQKVVAGMAWLMKRCMRVSGAESLVAATEVFVGMTEAPLAIRPYLARLTESELMAVMVCGLANIAGSVLALYVSFGINAGHLLCASVMSAPAALVIAKIMIPETGEPDTAGSVRIPYERTTNNVIDAAAVGATDGLKLALNVATMLVAFVALLALVNFLLAGVHEAALRWLGWGGFPARLEEIFGWLFRPLAFVMGVPWGESGAVGSLMGVKIGLNELIAYQKLAGMHAELSERSFTIATYALCGFANFGSLAIQIGGVSALVPERRQDLSRLSLRALAGGTLATFMTATIAGMLL
ncbi:MAG TPA: nucleoside transporter C-terminal domain-containing protein [Planctomycetota bacterium]|nr:nucleoside transporter C-terminal domain-containing protein [Planctomycetota bacterium]HRR81374.1 nucleoside transporter C-terminal domain-containing protein [Planctomycetota bacterium]HRT94546.1 nucleoside transporter C-terminal domain-containing protein [Planctomycetota bacterium]